MYFKQEKKAKLLQGRTIRYIAKQLDITEQYLCQILNNKRNCSLKLAKKIAEINNAQVEEYFVKSI
jgi:DNA-binding XRE family transcriptional regulator